MKGRIVAISDGKSSGVFECSEEDFIVIENAIDSLGNEDSEAYSPMVYIEKIEE